MERNILYCIEALLEMQEDKQDGLQGDKQVDCDLYGCGTDYIYSDIWKLYFYKESGCGKTGTQIHKVYVKQECNVYKGWHEDS